MTQKAEISNILSDPKFEVEKFLYYLNLQNTKPNLISTIMNDPNIFLYIAESPYDELLSDYADHQGFDKHIFKKLHEEMGLELWSKETRAGNLWYGVIADEDLAISYRNVNFTGEIEVFKTDALESTAAAFARARWKELKMHRIGSSSNLPKTLQPGEKLIDVVRANIYKLLEKIGYRRYYHYKGLHYCAQEPRIKASLPSVCTGFYLPQQSLQELQLWWYVTTKGPHKIEIVLYGKKPRYYIQRWNPNWEVTDSTLVKSVDEDKNPRDPVSIAEEIIEWAATKDPKLGTRWESTKTMQP